MTTITSLLIVTLSLFLVHLDARNWTPEYIDALLLTRQCYDDHVLSLMDSFTESLNETKLIAQFRARTMTILAYRIDRHEPFCVSLVESASHIYRELMWHNKQDIRRMTKKKVVPLVHKGREATLSHLQLALSNNEIRHACESLSSPNMTLLRPCVRDKRKDSMRAYTRYTE